MKNVKTFEKIMSANYTNIINKLATTYPEEQMNPMESYSLYFHFDVDNNLIGNIELSKVTDDRVTIPNENGGFTLVIGLPLFILTQYCQRKDETYILDRLGALQWIEDSISNYPLSDYVYQNDSQSHNKLMETFLENHFDFCHQ